MISRQSLILALYATILIMMLFVYFYVQRNFSYEQTHSARTGNTQYLTVSVLQYSHHLDISAQYHIHRF